MIMLLCVNVRITQLGTVSARAISNQVRPSDGIHTPFAGTSTVIDIEYSTNIVAAAVVVAV